jgi:hypothetical protein
MIQLWVSGFEIVVLINSFCCLPRSKTGCRKTTWLTQQTIDRQQLLPLVKSVCSTAQATPKTITASDH